MLFAEGHLWFQSPTTTTPPAQGSSFLHSGRICGCQLSGHIVYENVRKTKEGRMTLTLQSIGRKKIHSSLVNGNGGLTV